MAGSVDDTAGAYRLQEYQALHNEIMKRLERQTTLEAYTIVACAAVYGFLWTKPDGQLPPDVESLSWLLVWLPPALVAIGFARWRTNERLMGHIGDYLRNYHERHIREKVDKTYTGWAHFLEEASRRHRYRTRDIWFVVLFSTVLLAVVQTLHRLGFVDLT